MSQSAVGMIHVWLTPTTKMLYASDIFYLIATFSSRTAVICLLYALSPERLNKLVTKSGIVASLLMTVAAVLMVALGCNPGSPWTQYSQECTSVVRRHLPARCSVIY
jgi:threonine/homoserine/homoserine lactone efflux protein